MASGHSTRPSPVQDLTGRQFGRLTVMGRSETPRPGAIRWRCRCECGTVRDCRSDALRQGRTKSCGCLGRERRREAITSHDHSRHPLFKTWLGIIYRCHAPRSSLFANYGGRGITVCHGWRDSFESFVADMGPKPSPRHSIDRIDNDRGYSPDNCRWATRKEQQRNTRKCRWITFNGRTDTLTGWAETIGVSVQCLRRRIIAWGIDRALTAPPPAKPIISADSH